MQPRLKPIATIVRSSSKGNRKTMDHCTARWRGSLSGGAKARLISARAGFTLIEFLVAIGIIAILMGILIPYVLATREMSRRTECASRIGQIGIALQQYANDVGPHNLLPQTVYDAVHFPAGYTAFTGADDNNPFAKDSKVRGNDVTASLWLLVRLEDVKDTSVFTCPSTSDEPDEMLDANGKLTSPTHRGNFRSSSNLSYSYASPFTDAADYVFSSDRLVSEFAVLADRNPGFEGLLNDTQVLGPTRDAPPFELARGNSQNHGQAGQNVLHPAGNVSFETTPYCGVAHDNIYTAVAQHRLVNAHPALDVPGYLGTGIGAAYEYDSYLVPTARDVAPGDR